MLVIAPHPDDEAIGCGGTICLRVEGGDRVGAVFLTSGEQGISNSPPADVARIREQEAREAAQVLGLSWLEFLRLADQGVEPGKGAQALAPILRRERPDIILLPHPGDLHPDHQLALPLVRLALQQAGQTAELRGYEVWTPMPSFEYIEDISAVMPRKLEAISRYRSQVAQFRYDRAAAGLNQYRGALAARSDYAEVMVWLDPSPQSPPHPAAGSGVNDR